MGSSAYPKATKGCIRLRYGGIMRLKKVWSSWKNKKERKTCRLYVKY